MIELDNVSIRLDDFQLNHVNLFVPKGKSLVLIGPSGQGKSVLLKIIAGLLVPDEGRVLIDGKDLNNMSFKERSDTLFRMGMLFQKNALFDSLSCGENIAFPLREVKKLSEDLIQQKISFFLKAVDIAQARDLFPDEISGGMQKRLGIARALALDPEVILYDDPTAGLDPITSRLIVRLIKDLQAKRNSTLITITNDMNRAYQLADEIILIHNQKALVTGTVTETKNHKDPAVQQFIKGQLEGPLTNTTA